MTYKQHWLNPKSGTWVKRDSYTGRFMDVKSDGNRNIEESFEVPAQEDEANVFASYFLMPEEAFKSDMIISLLLNQIQLIG